MSTSTTGTGSVPPAATAAETPRRPRPPRQPEAPKKAEAPKKSIKGKLLLAAGVWIGGVIALVAIYGFKGTRNNAFEPQNEFKLDNWVHLGIFSINKAVLYLFLAGVADLREHDLDRAAHAGAPEQGAGRRRGAVRADARQHRRRRHGREAWPPSGSRSSARCSSSSSSRTSSATSRCRRTPSTRSTSSARTSPRSRCTQPRPTSRSRSCWRWSCSSPTPTKAFARRARSATSKA